MYSTVAVCCLRLLHPSDIRLFRMDMKRCFSGKSLLFFGFCVDFLKELEDDLLVLVDHEQFQCVEAQAL